MTAAVAADNELVLTTIAAPTVPATARAMLRMRLETWRIAATPGGRDRVFEMELCASELVTNACQAAPDSRITFKVIREPRAVWIGVWDSSYEDPVPSCVVALDVEDITPDIHALAADHVADDIGGWGLPLVIGLTTEREIIRTYAPSGKWVCCKYYL
ncbi:ATP-binding protein [Spirillospora sp. CA-294931]|uniref:ATP-binding protein n=1 Tax=Spirillospora sp. CA-294931 TaxID=3240042 RepID=UPI003D8D2CA4